MSNFPSELAEFCVLLGISDTTCLSTIKQYYRRFCVQFHPDKHYNSQPPPVVPPGANVCIINTHWFTAPATPGVYTHNGYSYTVHTGPVSPCIEHWSVENVLARLNCIKADALTQHAPARSRAYAPIMRKDVPCGTTLRVQYTRKERRKLSYEFIDAPPGRVPPYVIRGNHVDVLVFLRPD